MKQMFTAQITNGSLHISPKNNTGLGRKHFYHKFSLATSRATAYTTKSKLLLARVILHNNLKQFLFFENYANANFKC